MFSRLRTRMSVWLGREKDYDVSMRSELRPLVQLLKSYGPLPADYDDVSMTEDLVSQLPRRFPNSEVSRLTPTVGERRSHKGYIGFSLFAIVLAILALLWWKAASIPGVDDAASVAQTRSGLATVVVGSAGLLAGWTAWQKLVADERSASESRLIQERVRTADRVVAAASLIASDQEAVRLAGVSSLAGSLLSPFQDDRNAARELLLALLRGKQKTQQSVLLLSGEKYEQSFLSRHGGPDDDPSLVYPVVRLPADRNAALVALVASALLWDNPLDLRGIDLRGAFLQGYDLSGSIFIGTDLRSSVLRDCDLTKADFTDADMRSMVLDHCVCRGTKLEGHARRQYFARSVQ